MPEQQYNEISLKELIMILINSKKLILSIVILSLCVTVGFTFYQSLSSKSGEVIVSFNFSGIGSHTNPDGTSFDPYQIATPFILNDVIHELQLEGKISPNSIRSLIEMNPIIPKAITDKEEFLLEKSGDTVEFYPNEYILSVKTSRAANVNASLAQKIADQVVRSYQKYFTDEYIFQDPVVNKLSTFNAEKYDYSDISMVIHSQLDELKSFNNALYTLDQDFRSKRTGMSFYDIVRILDNIDKVDLNKLDSIISSYKLTKDDTKLVLYYEYMIERLEYQKSKALGQKNVTQEMLASIEDSSNSIVTSFTGGTADKSNSYFNSLILKTADTGMKISDISERIEYYKNEVKQLKNGEFIVNYDRKEILTEVNNLISGILKDINRWLQITQETSDEFYVQYMDNSVYALSPAAISDSQKPLLNIAIGTLLGLMIGIFTALFTSYWNNEKEIVNG